MFSLIEEIRHIQPDYHQVFIENKNKFKTFNGYRNNCSNTVRTFLTILGMNTSKVTAWADTIRNLGPVSYNPDKLKEGDVVAMGLPGNTLHVGIYFGEGKVLHQSAMRGYVVGVFEDINAFIKHRKGFYFVRPNIANRLILENQFFIAPELS